ncbi:MAG TPA: hypothetical protein VFV08_14415 [Puia sp.]|nr:hypothetical protein [Puia sp.]
MKRMMIFSIILILSTAYAFVSAKKNLVGHWLVKYNNGQSIKIEFRKNGTFETYLPAEKFTVGGKYKLEEDILSLNDTACDPNYWGKYNEKFFTDDSIYSTVIEDTCIGRKRAADQATLIRLKD